MTEQQEPKPMETYRWAYCIRCGGLFLLPKPEGAINVMNPPEIIISTVPSAVGGLCFQCFNRPLGVLR